MRYLLILLFIIIIPKQINAEEMVKVKLINYIGDTQELDIALKGDYITLDPALSLKENVNYRISVQKGQIHLKGNGKHYQLKENLIIIPGIYDRKHQIYVNGRPYLGSMEFRLEKNKVIRPINQLAVEDYLKGVVPFEVYPSWNMETLKAQALAARTYTYSHINEVLDDTIFYQVYGGYTWNKRTIKAVDETTDEVITFHRHLIDALYSASNGGVTENNAHVWGGKPISYFPIKLDPYDPGYPWTFTLHQTQINIGKINWDHPNWWNRLKEQDEEITATIKLWLQKNGFPGDIKILSIPRLKLSNQQLQSKRTENGSITIEFLHRLIDGTILYESVDLVDVKLKTIRSMIGGNVFKSYLIDSLQVKKGVYTVKGKGYGHGVGMSQWGASIMGENGKTYKEILQFYYPGTSITPYHHQERSVYNGSL
ncbi:modulator protein [Bacillus sp. SA1-12]|uniref:SpoIID/LytB domain-containing protein n=1 Tax=Bacillus sp. SA1-12 TaxID=1455638 RepID=UPI0006272181|nr:SpoIID/LytB domain-containing protein [Bacillus sp. SA1-12]KKI90348.1 modulator protein [Bacillus sp. SA1-12]